MTNRINCLPLNLINQIAAGEVIERPASVVKEMLENSIDAGSTRVEIEISNDCRNIRISDNGSGIHPEDVEIAFFRHATSKISSEEDLWNISTLGFRGEALSSIGSVAKVICTTKTKDFDYGLKVFVENSVIQKQKVGCANGTTMEVENLFSTQPARLKFLKSDKTEFSYINDIVTQAALYHYDIGFTLIHNGQKTFSYAPESDLGMRIKSVYKVDIDKELRYFEKTDNEYGMKVYGYTSLPSYTRANKKFINIYVNGRPIKCPIVLKAVDVAYKNLLPIGKYPFSVINIQVNPSEIDVNAHPTKREIRYKNPNLIFNFVMQAVNDALTSPLYSKSENNSIISLYDRYEKRMKSDNDIVYSSNSSSNDEKNNKNNQFNLFGENKSEEKAIDINYEMKQLTAKLDNGGYKESFLKVEKPLTDRIIGQFNNTYILIEKDDGLEIVDQHIADERYLYEKFKSEKQVVSQIILISDVIELSAGEVELLVNASEKLEQYGYQIEKKDDTHIIYKKLPQILSKTDMKDITQYLLENLDNSLDDLEEKIIITTACKGAIKAGEKISLWQAEELIRRWRNTKNPEVCPHGRPISNIIKTKDIAKMFLRQ